MKKVGVIGVGVVGQAVYDGLSVDMKVFGYDKFKTEYNEIPEIFETECIFICVPTATVKGKQDLKPLEETFKLLKENKYKGVIVVKSTVLPGTTETLADKYGLTRVCHNPEFLTAATPYEDFMNQSSILISGSPRDTKVVRDVYFEAGFINVLEYPDTKITEMQKYFHNNFLAVKVSFCNEIYEACQHLGIDYDEVREGTVSIGGLGAGHSKVPGPERDADGKPMLGFGGMCFPKDTSAFSTFAAKEGIPAEVLNSAIAGNKRRRPKG